MEESSQENSYIFSVRIVTLDYYMSPPIPNFDISYSNFQGGSVKEVPVIRIYGATPAGQKACVHVHRALPYFYVPCSDIPLQINPEGSIYENAISLAVEKALKLKGKAGSKRQHVHSCTLVRARKFYGYHSSEELFVKIYLYYPQDVSRAANLLLSGAVFEKCLQPYESHIPFLLQFLVDYNLYGMGHMHLVKTKFRHPVPDDCLAENVDHVSPEAFVSTSSESQAGATANLQSPPLFWRSSTIPAEWMWQNSSIHGASSSHVDNMMKRQSICELEGDTTVEDIMNQQLKMYTSLSQTRSDVRMVQSLVPIWEEEFERSGLHDAEMLADPGRPSPQDVLKTLSNGIEYVDKLLGLYGKAESELLAASEDVKSIVSSQCPRKEGNTEDADPEDVALLNWLASSQAAKEFNSDDELHRETILNPLLPAATIDKVLEKANTDYENESQQECQDILDSIVDVLKSDDQMGKTSVGQDSSHTNIPQLDGAGDDQQFSPAADSSEKMDTETVSSKRHSNPLRSSSFDNKQKRHKLQWGSLPFPEVQQSTSDIHFGPSTKSADNSGCCDSRALISCSVRDLMRRKRSFRAESSESGKNEVEEGSAKEMNEFHPRKLEFHMEPLEAQTLQTVGCSTSSHVQIEEHTEACEVRLPASTHCPGGKEEQEFADFSVTCKDKEPDLGRPSLKSSTCCLNRSDNVAAKTFPELSDYDDMFVDEKLRKNVCGSSSCLYDVGTCAHIVSDNVSKNVMGTDGIADPQYPKVSSVELFASSTMGPAFAFGCKEEDGATGYVTMTFHKKPPLASWKDGTSENSASLPVHSYQCSPKYGSDDEGTSVQDGTPEDVRPFFTDSCKGVSKHPDGVADFCQDALMGVPTHFQNDGSYAYLLTPAVSPPSSDSVLKWLTLEEKEQVRAKPLPDSTHLSPLEPMDNQLDGENHRILNIKGGRVNDEACLNEGSPLREKEVTKSSQDISQISGPSGQSKPTPLSQMGFRDPASVGAGQQLTLFSVEVQAESRGDLRPDPQHDTINMIVIAVQNDGSPSVDIYVLLRGPTEGCGRYQC